MTVTDPIAEVHRAVTAARAAGVLGHDAPGVAPRTTGMALFGMEVIQTPVLPLVPSDGENARRMVRHGMRDVLEWLGEPVGPKPGHETHVLIVGNYLHASARIVGQLREQAYAAGVSR